MTRLSEKLVGVEEPLTTKKKVGVLSEDEDDCEDSKEVLFTKDIYKELRIRGYDYGPKFRGLVEARGDGKRGRDQF